MWQDGRYGQWAVYVYDLTASEEKRIAAYEGGGPDGIPAVSNELVVYEQWYRNWDPGGSRYFPPKVYAYSLAAGEELETLSMSGFEGRPAETRPAVSGAVAVWRIARDGYRQAPAT